MITTRRLGKSLGRFEAFREVDLDVADGECVGISGPAGTGPSTLLEVLGTLVAPTTGTVTIAGIDAVAEVYEARRHVVHVGTNVSGHCRLSARDRVRFVHAVRTTSQPAARGRAIDDALTRADLDPDAIVDTLSGDMRARLALVTALVLQPRVLLLDQPFHSVEVRWHGPLSEWLREVREAGTTMVLTVTDGDPLTALCHRVEHLAAGRLVAGLGTATTAFAGQTP